MDNYLAIVNLSIIVLFSYLVGSIPTSIIVSKAFKGIDIRKHGSGNAGGTNTFRVLGWKAGLIVVIVDILKGFIATRWISQLNLFNSPLDTYSLTPVLAGAAAIIGHCYTVFAGFKGGKGVATAAGMLIAISPVSFLICVLVFAAVLTTSGYVSLSSMTTAVALPVSVLIRRFVFSQGEGVPFFIFSLLISGFIVYSHRGNIKRLLSGKENRFNKVRIFKRK